MTQFVQVPGTTHDRSETRSLMPIREPGGAEVLAAADAVERLLRPALDRDWTAQVPGLDFTAASVTAHVATGLAWYSFDLWGGTQDSSALDLKVDTGAAPDSLLATLLAAARSLAAGVSAAPPELRGFHPAGAADASGFAAMSCDELLIHADDAARGLGLPFAPDAGLAALVLARLFPWHEPGDDPWQVLRWANGRTDLPGRPSQQGWQWHCQPLADWDGAVPAQREV
jgi:uncharacterized protein (TIGR03083 family)